MSIADMWRSEDRTGPCVWMNRRSGFLEGGLLALFSLYIVLLAFLGDNHRFYILFFLAAVIVVILERMEPQQTRSVYFRRLLIGGLLLFALLNLLSAMLAVKAPGMEFSQRNNDSFYGVVMALSLALGLRRRSRVEWVLAALMVSFGLWGFLELIVMEPQASFFEGRFVGYSRNNANLVAMTLLILLAVYVSYAFAARARVGMVMALLGVAVTGILLFLTRSRFCLLTLVFVTIPLAIVTQRRVGTLGRRLLAGCLIVFLIGPALSIAWYKKADPDRRSFHNALVRVEAWKESLRMATHEPWYRIFIGHGSIKAVGRKLGKHYFGERSTLYANGHAHHTFLQTLIETGILGLANLAFIFALAIHGAVRGRSRELPGQGDLSPVFIVPLVTVLVAGQLDLFLHHRPGKLVWIILGLALAYGRLASGDVAVTGGLQEARAR